MEIKTVAKMKDKQTEMVMEMSTPDKKTEIGMVTTMMDNKMVT